MTKLPYKPLPPLELLQELFEISPDSPSGLIWRSSRSNCIKVGQIAGRKNNKGYWDVRIKVDTSKLYKTHRIVYFMQTQKDPETAQVDHIFGKHDPLNLRLATNAENIANSKKIKAVMGKKCSSKFKGVCWNKENKKWQTKLMFQGQRIHLGYFVNETEAAVAYNKAATKYFGEFAKLNTFEELV